MLAPGDATLFRRGCEWTRTPTAFTVDESGTSSARLVFGAYGTGARPIIRGGYDAFRVNGSWAIVEGIEVRNTAPPNSQPNCPTGWRTGFGLYGSHVTLRYVKASENTTGVHVSGNGFHVVTHSEFTNNYYLSRNTVGGTDDSGAWGVLVNASDNEVDHNYLSGNNAWCSYDFGQEGASVELGGALRNRIHHNRSVDDTTFTELTNGDSNNRFYYNLIVNRAHSRVEAFNLRGSDNDVRHNTVSYSSPSGKGIVGGDVASDFSDNVIDAPQNYIGGTQTRNYWGNPGFVDPGAYDFHLADGSAATDAGQVTAGNVDLDGVAVPQKGAADLGAYEGQ